MKKPVIVYVRLTVDQDAGLSFLVKNEPGTRSDHVRQAVNEYLQRKLVGRKEVADEGQLERVR